MSELRIAIAAEGRTDFYIIKSALDGILAGLSITFRPTMLQPEITNPKARNGWAGVANWCSTISQRHKGEFDDDPFFFGFDVVIIHVDADVASKSYSHENQFFEDKAVRLGWNPLPCNEHCPPPTASCARVADCTQSWLAGRRIGGKLVLCLPAQSSGTWFAHAVMPPGDGVLLGGECDPRVEGRLATLPMDRRIKKNSKEYRDLIPQVADRWADIKAACTQASQFESDFLAALPPPAAAAP